MKSGKAEGSASTSSTSSTSSAPSKFFQRNSNKYCSLPASLSKKQRHNRKALEDDKAARSSSTPQASGNYKDTATSKQPYGLLDESLDDVSLSLHLSTESLKNSSEFFEERENTTATTLLSLESPGQYLNDEEQVVLSELDAILDTHDDSSQTKFIGFDYDDKIEDCLMDLDLYLDKMDKASPLETVENSVESLGDKADQSHRISTLPKNIGSSKSNPQSSRFRRSQSFCFSATKEMDADGQNGNSDWCLNQNEISDKQVDQLAMETSSTREEMKEGQDNGENDEPEVQRTSLQILTEEQIMNILLENESRGIVEDRPRQFGRRGEQPMHSQAYSVSFAETAAGAGSNPAFACDESQFASYNLSDGSSLRSSHAPSPLTTSSTSDSASSENIESQTVISDHLPAMNASCAGDAEGNSSPSKNNFNSIWPNGLSRGLALLCCTLGLLNVCRFAVLSVNYGLNFMIQFLILSILFGIPLFWLQMCLGAKIKAGPVSMWKISPICTGIGLALVLVQFVIAIYSTVCIAWIFVYMKDTLPLRNSVYRWEEPVSSGKLPPYNLQNNLTENVADYFNIWVLQRTRFDEKVHLGRVPFGGNDRLPFYLAIIWTLVFLFICRGLKSFGKMVLLVGTLPLLCLIVSTGKFVWVVGFSKLQSEFLLNDLDEFLVNSRTWSAAAQETFLTWGLMGASTIALTSRTHPSSSATTLKKESIFVVFMTFLGLGTASILGLCCKILLRDAGFVYVPGSYERPDCYTSVFASHNPLVPKRLLEFPSKLLPYYASVLGDTYRRPDSLTHLESGYQALRFVTELFPAAVAVAHGQISWVWVVLMLGTVAGLGVGQLCVMWKPISGTFGDSTSSVLLCCMCGLLLSFPFASELGIYILYYIDFLFGGSWILPVLWVALIFGVFLVRGRPYNGDDLVNDLHMCGSLSAFLALSWNLLLPIGLISLAILSYKVSFTSQFYYWRGKAYFGYVSRKLGSLLQIGFLLIVPIISIVQIYRYLTDGPPDILDRIQNLYRPPMEGEYTRRRYTPRQFNGHRSNANGSGDPENERHNSSQNDAPPKYTPPPSYTTATGVRFAKILRHSIRRSVRRLLGDPQRSRLPLPIESNANVPSTPPISVDSLMHRGDEPDAGYTRQVHTESIEISHIHLNEALAQNSGAVVGKNLPERSSKSSTPTSNIIRRSSSNAAAASRLEPYTANDVVQVLRSTSNNSDLVRVSDSPTTYSAFNNSFRSIETLILNAEPPGQSPAIATNFSSNRNDENDSNLRTTTTTTTTTTNFDDSVI